MSGLIAAPELISTAATDLANIGSTLSSANSAAAPSTATVPAAAADQVSAAVAQLLSAHGQEYQALAGQVEAFHQQFTQNLQAGAGAYTAAEAANAAVMQPLGSVAGAVAGAAVAAANPVVQWFNQLLVDLQNLIGRFLLFLFAPILDPIINSLANAIATAIVQGLFK
ncbi:PE family protein [Mycobacterium sp. UM_CSW]|uniref:PE family protein n=1 Tax=Mycobacterium sp. UM_CSW TaxID=1370119 RepID=UPI0004077CB1|nr:PE family protein [Mycobacterium sp. UM_CSW]